MTAELVDVVVDVLVLLSDDVFETDVNITLLDLLVNFVPTLTKLMLLRVMRSFKVLLPGFAALLPASYTPLKKVLKVTESIETSSTSL
ncbi:hypothetical protein VZ94_17650 [Methylocucumis oryzae]|uniref:Uncharacterized protein n=1 Tax=Methylocucumis oryzae TaxID=1632867 RepID=A0A0F3IFN7_9GAMM|nr:hypothetical protein VZ94_17650 [Methylocucumis oryzae]